MMSDLKDCIGLDLYEILQIDYTCEVSEIKAAYRKLARLYHPDVNPLACEKFKRIKIAYEILSNNISRKEYDKIKGISSFRRYSKGFEAKKAYEEDKEKYSSVKQSSKLFSDDRDFSSTFNEILEGIFKTRNNKKYQKRVDGKDITLQVEIDSSEAKNGSTQTINVLHTQICKVCFGSGYNGKGVCSKCKGKGYINKYKELNVKIVANISNNARIRIANEGNRGQNGGKNGDLYLIIKIRDSKYKVDEKTGDVSIDVPISPFEAVLGCEISIKAYNSENILKIKISKMTKSGQKFKLKNEGTFAKNSGQKGDLIVRTFIQIPNSLTEEQIDCYNKLKEISRDNLRENFL